MISSVEKMRTYPPASSISPTSCSTSREILSPAASVKTLSPAISPPGRKT